MPPPDDARGSGPVRVGAAGRLSWIVGAAILVAVVVAVLRSSEERELYRLAREARPWWMLVAIALQAATYLFQGEIWRVVTRAANVALDTLTVYRLSLGKLFVDQALPLAGISGNILMLRALQDRHVPRPVIMAGVVVDTASCYGTYVFGLAIALVITTVHHQASGLVLLASILFATAAITIAAGALALSGRRAGSLSRKIARIAPLRRAMALLQSADPRLARRPRTLVLASLCQLAILVLDTATIWALIAALGAWAAPTGVFASFMISTLFRLIGVMPGGLGAFEAASVLTLKMIGVSVPVALAATLLFRGLSFWLPMLPGLWFARHVARA